MLRVLIAVEDYGELLYLQTLLKKIGFDVEGVQNERGFEEARLSLNPEILLISARGKRIKGINLASQFKKLRGFPKIILLYPENTAPSDLSKDAPGADGAIEAPINPRSILTLIAELGGLNSHTIVEKYKRIRTSLSAEEEADLEILRRDNFDDEGSYDSSLSPEKGEKSQAKSSRKKRYEEFLKSVEPPPFDGFSRDKVIRYHKSIRASEDPKAVEDLEIERQNFVKALFKKDED